MTADIANLAREMRTRAEAAGRSHWGAGCLATDAQTCNCAYIFDEGHCGGIGEVCIDNGKSIRDGGNDCPTKDEARANLRHITASCPANVLAILDALDQRTAELDAARETIGRLCEALEPFGPAADLFTAQVPDTVGCGMAFTSIKVGDFRRAARVLADVKGGAGDA